MEIILGAPITDGKNITGIIDSTVDTEWYFFKDALNIGGTQSNYTQTGGENAKFDYNGLTDIERASNTLPSMVQKLR